MSSSVEAVVERGISQANKSAWRNPWVLGWIALVSVVFAVNAFMITMAFTTSPGLVEKDYYEQGRDYERTLQTRMAERAALAWKLSLNTPDAITEGRPAALNLGVLDKAGAPLANAQVKVHVYRPSDANADFYLPLAEKSSGQYVGDVTFPLKGIWDLIIDVKQGTNSYQMTQRVLVLGS